MTTTKLVGLLVVLLCAVDYSYATNTTKGNWPEDLPVAWNWCDLGYCTPIKYQCGGSCVNTAKLEVIETRIHMSKHPKQYKNFIKHHFNMHTYKPPPKIEPLSLQHYMECKFDRNYLIDDSGKPIPPSVPLTPDEVLAYGKGTRLVQWIQQWGIYAEKDFPRDGTCGMCKYKNCSTVECMLDHLPSSCSKQSKALAIKNKDPCECVDKIPQQPFDPIHKACQKNLMDRHFEPCSCERMMNDNKKMKPWFDAETMKKHPDISKWFEDNWPATPGDKDEPKDAPYARTIFKDGPVTDHVWFADLNPNPKKASLHCPPKSNHEIEIVGWNYTSDRPYWIIRNSWSDSWGDGGYGYVGMNCPCHAKCGGMA